MLSTLKCTQSKTQAHTPTAHKALCNRLREGLLLEWALTHTVTTVTSTRSTDGDTGPCF